MFIQWQSCLQRNNIDKYCHSTVNMPKFIILEAVTEYHDEDNSTIKTLYINIFFTVIYNYSK